jgi:hypothetical protein
MTVGVEKYGLSGFYQGIVPKYKVSKSRLLGKKTDMMVCWKICEFVDFETQTGMARGTGIFVCLF